MADKLLLLNLRKLALFIGAWILAFVLHNAVYGLFRDSFGPGGDEPFFFLLAVVVIPAWFVVALLYTVIHWTARGRRTRHGAP